MNQNEQYYNVINLKNWLNLAAVFSLVIHLLNPHLANAQSQQAPSPASSSPLVFKESPEGKMFKESKPDKVVKSVITAYTSTPDQTDSSPFIAATGKRVHDGMIAANWLPFGTIVKIPELFGDKLFVVEDRMNARYGYGRLDIWMDTTKQEARKFGVKRALVEVYLPAKK